MSYISINGSIFNAIANIPDCAKRIARYDAFWQGAIVDRPPVYIQVKRRNFETCDMQRWREVEYQVKTKANIVMSFDYYGDALPSCTPNLGPDFFASLYGAEIDFERNTSFMQHSLNSLEDFQKLNFGMLGKYFDVMEQMYDGLFELGKDKFYVGWPDLHPGADCLVGLRGPAELCMDLYDQPEQVKLALSRISADFQRCFDHYCEKLTRHSQIFTGWPLLFSSKKWHVPSNDFSYMISETDFTEFFLATLEQECAYLEASLFHLDGPGSLTQLDKILSVKQLNAVQWVYGAGNGSAKDWIHVYKKIQAAGKGIQIFAQIEDLNAIFDNLKPEGTMMVVYSVKDTTTAKDIIRKVEQWH